MRLLLEANNLFNEEKYIEAINKYEDLLKIDKSHREALWQLGSVFLRKKKFPELLQYI